jgi:chromatin segregation and condensation protein Rec8/ScpA/Scc1 (kleisin family)
MEKVEHYLNDREAAKFLRLSPQTLRNWRSQCRGPVYIRAGRRILYSIDDLKQFMANNRVEAA